MNKKETAKMEYVRVIREKQTVRPTELPFNRVRYDYIDELEGEGKICRKIWGTGYTLLFMPGNENIAQERYKRDIENNKRTCQKQNTKEQSQSPPYPS